MTMIEKVARALCVADGYAPEECDTEVGHTPAPLWHDYINRARAAIEAMREPAEGMVDAGTASITGRGVPDDDYTDDMRRAWTAMIASLDGEG